MPREPLRDRGIEGTANTMKTVVILGGGFTGLRIAWLLRKAGHRPVIIEREPVLGGMVQSFRRCVGNDTFSFDYGPHLFFDEREADYRALIGPDLLRLVDRFQMWAAGSLLSYPVRMSEAFRHIGILGLAGSAVDMARMNLAGKHDDDDLEAYMVQRFGRKVFRTFYAAYVEKCTGLPVGETSSVWGRERANVTGGSLAANALNKARQWMSRKARESLKRHNAPTASAITAWYPRLGSGQICDAMAAALNPEDVYTGAVPLAMNCRSGAVTDVVFRHEGTEKRALGDFYVSTIPLPDVVGLFRPNPAASVAEAARRLKFRGLRLVNLVLNRDRALSSLEVFSMDAKHVFKRVYEPKAMSATMAPPGRTSLCLEVCETEGDSLWKTPDGELFERCLQGLRDMGIAANSADVLDAFTVRLPHAYPIYHRGFQASLDQVLACVSDISNLATCGRQGLFRYHTLTNEAMTMADDIIRLVVDFRGQKTTAQDENRWGRNYY